MGSGKGVEGADRFLTYLGRFVEAGAGGYYAAGDHPRQGGSGCDPLLDAPLTLHGLSHAARLTDLQLLADAGLAQVALLPSSCPLL